MSRAVFVLIILLLGLSGIGLVMPGPENRADAEVVNTPEAAPRTSVQPVRPRLPLPVQDVLQSGVLVVVSKASQRMHVFKDGEHWGSSPVSTGKRGHSTPAGVFPILQKRVFHRSNIYSNAPMPYMQRLTWRGIAIHAGFVPGYPASHGCIRLPRSFAKALFDLTRADRTTVVITNAPLQSEEGAVTLALNVQGPAASPVQTAALELAALTPRLPNQTIQLVAAPSPREAESHWQGVVALHPELASFQKAIVPAVVGQRRYWRLRASAPGAHAVCGMLKRSGQDCFNVI